MPVRLSRRIAAARAAARPSAVERYRQRISGPLLDRIDLHVEVPALSEEDFARAAPGEASGPVRERVARARLGQLERQGAVNARLLGVEIAQRARPDAKALRVLRDAASRMALSARAHDRVLKVARTIADLDGAARVGERHVAEALRYRDLPLADGPDAPMT